MTPQSARAIAVGVVLIVVSTAIYQFGRHVKAGEVAEETLKTARAQATQVQQLQDKADLLATANGLLRASSAPKERLITKEITRYVDVTPVDQRCTLPGSWRLRHDAAATGEPLAEAGSVATGSAEDVEDAAALETVGENYAVARECLAKLDGWQQRYRELELADGEQ